MHELIKALGLQSRNDGVYLGSTPCPSHGAELVSINPSTGAPLASVVQANREDYDEAVAQAVGAFQRWRERPAPARGEIVRLLGDALRKRKRTLGALVSLEMGKIRAEGEGEVQEMIDICDFAVGLSRQLYGLSMHSERPGHRMYEQWHPLGPVGVITSFNFPVAVWAWNAAIALVCGDTLVWKPSSETPLTALAVQQIFAEILREQGCPPISVLTIGRGSEIGDVMLGDPRLPLISATGSCSMGRRVAEIVGRRFGRTILELGGNNAIIVLPDANLGLATRAVLFGAVGTAGQRCTSTRRLLVHRSILDEMMDRLVKVYSQVRIGDPLEEGTLMGPLINRGAVEDMMQALERGRREGCEIVYGGHALDRPGFFVEPTLVRASADASIVREETFAPILYLMPFDDIDEAIAMNNGVPQGLSSAIFTQNIQLAERFLSCSGSDCGIANVNIGTSGAEIGGAFGGEKETGGGREAGSDSWKQYMRRQTCTINWSSTLALAQGIRFGDGED